MPTESDAGRGRGPEVLRGAGTSWKTRCGRGSGWIQGSSDLVGCHMLCTAPDPERCQRATGGIACSSTRRHIWWRRVQTCGNCHVPSGTHRMDGSSWKTGAIDSRRTM